MKGFAAGNGSKQTEVAYDSFVFICIQPDAFGQAVERKEPQLRT